MEKDTFFRKIKNILGRRNWKEDENLMKSPFDSSFVRMENDMVLFFNEDKTRLNDYEVFAFSAEDIGSPRKIAREIRRMISGKIERSDLVDRSYSREYNEIRDAYINIETYMSSIKDSSRVLENPSLRHTIYNSVYGTEINLSMLCSPTRKEAKKASLAIKAVELSMKDLSEVIDCLAENDKEGFRMRYSLEMKRSGTLLKDENVRNTIMDSVRRQFGPDEEKNVHTEVLESYERVISFFRSELDATEKSDNLSPEALSKRKNDLEATIKSLEGEMTAYARRYRPEPPKEQDKEEKPVSPEHTEAQKGAEKKKGASAPAKKPKPEKRSSDEHPER